MSIVVTTNTDSQEPMPSTSVDKAEVTEAAADEKPSVEAQGEPKDEPKEVQLKEEPGESEDDDAVVTEERPKKKSGIQRLKERHAREMAEIRGEIESLKTQAPLSKREEATQTTQPSDKPRAETFEGTHEEFVEALTDWKLEQREKLNAEKSKDAQAKEAFESQKATHNERVAKFRAEVPEYDTVVEEFMEEHGQVSFSPALAQVVRESELGPKIMLELFKNPDEFARVNALGPLAAAKTVGLMEAKLSKQDATNLETKQTTTKAPPPPTPITGKSDKATKKSIYDEGLSQSDYERLRREQMKKSWGA